MDGEQRGREREEQEPKRCRKIRHHAGDEHDAVRGMESLHERQTEVHQIALAPAVVALQFVDEVGRHFLVAARQVEDDPNFPAGAPHQRRLDEIMRQDLAGQIARSRQAPQ